MPEPLDENDWVTQYGDDEQGFRNRPRSGTETDVSTIAGLLDPQDAARTIRRTSRVDVQHRARYANVGVLRACGFTVERSPSKMNAQHVSIRVDGYWTDNHSVQLDECFEEEVRHEASDDHDQPG